MTSRPPQPLLATAGAMARLRRMLDKGFTALAAGSILLIAAVLVAVLAPMLWRGAGAVVFRGTVEFRKMQLEQFNRGDSDEVRAEAAETARVRQAVYDRLDLFKRGISMQELHDEARRTARELGKQLERGDRPADEQAEVRALGRKLRDALLDAYETTDKAAAQERVAWVVKHAGDPRLKDTVGEAFLGQARSYERILATVDLAHRAEYAAALAEVQDALARLLGPRPNEPKPALVIDQYGVTRWDMAKIQFRRLNVAERWVADGPGRPLRLQEMPREQQFAGTDLAPIFPFIRAHAEEMLRPRTTVYWQYFYDSNMSGHYFGGVGPEILGTLLITALAVALALPLGVISAAYMVECAGDSRIVHILRTCINTLAGVPSIIFGLFGLAFFVIFLLPHFGMTQGSSILAGAMTLALLVLPVIIRAGEEAIRAVPPAYKEAALALGAGRLRCFVTVILPAALPGILTGVILSVSRAAGETAPILFTAAVAMGATAWPPWSALGKPTPTLSYASYHMAVGDRLAKLVPHNQFGMVMTLIVLVLVLNVAAIVVRSRVARKLRGQ